ncbi:MAG TPA: tetratricopeptide repeat protein, partial [Stellaceae bacterium]
MPLFRRDRREPSVISRADRAREAGQWELAAGLYGVALDRTPRNPPIWIQYGHALKETGDCNAAEAAYRNAIAYRPDDPDAYLQLGHVLKLQGKIAEARAAYQRALVLDASCADASRELNQLQRAPGLSNHGSGSNGFGMAGSGEMLPTVAMASPAVRRQLRRGRGSLISRADRAREAQQWDIAADLYRRALDRNPDRPDIWVQYGHALKESGNPVEAERAYRAAIARDPGAADPHLQLGHVLKLQGKQEEAEAAYLRAFALDPGLPHPVAGLHGLGWSETRFTELRRMVSDTPNSIVSTNALSNGSGAPIASVPGNGGTTIDTPRGSAVVTDQGLFSLPIEQQAKCLREAGLFDSEWYLSRYPDVAARGIDPAQHFLLLGAAEGRKPNSNFETARYCDAFPRVGAHRDQPAAACLRETVPSACARPFGASRHHAVRFY